MFRPTDPQVSLLESQFLVPPAKRRLLEASWAHPFQRQILPLIDEDVFRECFSDNDGRPNKSVRLLTALHLLKAWNDLTDAQVLEQFEFNLQWQYALGVEPSRAHVCQKTLHNFRARLLASQRAQELFEGLTRGLVELDGLDVGRQRLDSTHVISDIAVLTRLGLFTETTTKFLRELRRQAPDKLAALSEGYSQRYLDREGYFSDATKEQARRRLPMVAVDIYRLVQAFAQDEMVRQWDAYRLLKRLFEEQCEVVEGDEVQPTPAKLVRERATSGHVEPTPAADESTAAPANDGSPATSSAGLTLEAAPDGDAAGTQDTVSSPVGTGQGDAGNDVATGAADEGAEPGVQSEQAEAPRAARRADSEAAVEDGEGDAGNDAPAPGVDEHAEPGVQGEQAETPREAASQAGGQADSEVADVVEDGEATPVRLRDAKTISSASLQTPHDPDATYGRKGKGYEVQVAETCTDGNPYQVVTGVSVNGAHESDQHATVPMVDQLQASQLGPDELLADTGYGSGQNIVDCANRGVDLQAPVQDPDARKPKDPWEAPVEASEQGRPCSSAPAPAGPGTEPTAPPAPGASPTRPLGLESFGFTSNYDKLLRCPAGHAPSSQHLDRSGRRIWAQFASATCAACPLAATCPTREKRSGERTLRCSRSKAATARRQAEQQEPAFKERYKKRSGVESTNAELKGPYGADDLRVRGRPRVELAILLKAMALNAKRAVRYHVARLRDAVDLAHEPNAVAA